MSINDQIRHAGMRSRAIIPNIGQGSSPQPGPAPAPQSQPAQPMPQQPAPMQAAQPPNPMRAPAIQPSTFTIHPPGSPADPNQYNYEPQPDGSWRVYPPGINAPPHTSSASLPRAASTGDYMRMSKAFSQQTPVDPNAGI